MSEPVTSSHNMSADDEIDLREIWRVLVIYKVMIFVAMFVAAVIAAGVSLTMPNIYRAEVLLAPVSGDGAKGGGLSAALGGLGGLATLADISLPSSGSTEENIAILKSREFLWKFVQENQLMPILFEDKWDVARKHWKEADPIRQPGQMDALRSFNNVLNVSTDKRTSLVTVSIEWINPELAASWANLMVEQLNQHLRMLAIARSESNLKFLKEELARTQIEEMRKALFELIGQEQKSAMLANAQREFAFRVLDRAVVSDQKIKPKRTPIVLMVAIFAGFMAILVALIRSRKGKGKMWMN